MIQKPKPLKFINIIIKKKVLQLLQFKTQNYKQILFKICKINYICRNTISNYGDKTNKYTNFLNLKKYGNHSFNFISKTCVNPFENIVKKN